MSEFKDFQGKTLDEAIQMACDHFGMGREKLEIEIISGGSTGVFGIMGVRKARLKARPRKAIKTDEFMNGNGEKAANNKKSENRKQPKREQKPKRKPEPKAETKPEPEKEAKDEKPAAQESAETKAEAPKQEVRPEEPQAEAQDAPDVTPEPQPEAPQPEVPEAPKQNAESRRESAASTLESLDKDEIEATIREALGRMLEPIVGEAKLDITFDTDRVKVFIDDEENSGLIIGREGQTLSSLQYLVNRLVSRKMETSVRVQIDTGDYRERQDDKLRQLAEHLADKAVNQGRTQSTKPLSSYHRRVVHLTLQDKETVFTRSKGDGPLKRVLIVPKRRGGGRRNNARNER